MFSLRGSCLSYKRLSIGLAHSLPHHPALLHHLWCSVVRILRDNLAPHRAGVQHIRRHSPLGGIRVRAERLFGLVNLIRMEKRLEFLVVCRFFVFLFLGSICSLLLLRFSFKWRAFGGRCFLPHFPESLPDLCNAEVWVVLHHRRPHLVCPHKEGRKWTLGCIVIFWLFSVLSKAVL